MLGEIHVKVLPKELKDGEERDEMFGVELYDASNGLKISKRNTAMIELVKDAKSAFQANALASLLEKIREQEKKTFGQQFKNAIMLHPTKNESGEIEQVSGGRAFFHFISIGWKVLFSIVPPAHMAGGWACFFVALAFIGLVVVVVGETAMLFGCVVGLKDGLTAVTFVAIGTSLPDTFASKTAAQKERYADAAIGNITGSNCVNVFLGLGIPWMISTIYYHSKGTTNIPSTWDAAKITNMLGADIPDTTGIYYVPQGSLTIAVITYLVCSVVGFAILIIRRIVVKGELGGSDSGRFGTAFLFTLLWIAYVIVVGLAAYGYFDEPTTTVA